MNFFKRYSSNAAVDVKEQFEAFIKRNNIKVEKETDKERTETFYTFSFQGGNFKARIGDDGKYVYVVFPAFYELPFEHVDTMRMACNRFNSIIYVFRLTYSHDTEQNVLHSHLSFHVDYVEDTEFANRLMGCFHYQRKFIEYVEDLLKDCDGEDIEKKLIEDKRRTFLLNQQEINHQPGASQSYRINDTQGFPLGQMLNTCLDPEERTFKELVLTTPVGTSTITQADAIAATDVVRPLVNDDITGFNPGCVTAVLTYTAAGSCDDRYITLSAVPSGTDDTSCYVRVTITVVPVSVYIERCISSRETIVDAVSIVVAVDRQSAENKLQEFNYMWEDAVIKLKNGEELTDEQDFLARITGNDLAYNYYWGMQYFKRERYYEAILFLENAFTKMCSSFFSQEGSKNRKRIFEVAYCLGYSYNELKNYHMAFYYLNLLDTSPSISHAQEYVNSLVNSRDVRSFMVIDGMMESVKRTVSDSDEGEAPEYVLRFADFLQRRKGYACIDFGLLDEAEKVFTALLESPYSHDYAINELAYIKKLRDQHDD